MITMKLTNRIEGYFATVPPPDINSVIASYSVSAVEEIREVAIQRLIHESAGWKVHDWISE